MQSDSHSPTLELLRARRDRLTKLIEFLEADGGELALVLFPTSPPPALAAARDGAYIADHAPKPKPRREGKVLAIKARPKGKQENPAVRAEAARAWIASLGVAQVRSKDAARALGCSAATASGILARAVERGTLNRLGQGLYAAPITLRPAAPRAPFANEDKPPRAVAKVADVEVLPTRDRAWAILQIAARQTDWWSATQMVAWMQKEYPLLVASANQLMDLRVKLLDLKASGKLDRTGRGAGAFYRLTGAPTPPAGKASVDEEEERLRISVPRDPDAGQY